MPPEFAVTGSPVTQSGTISSVWATAANLSWFGNMEGAAGQPRFYNTPFPLALIPDLDASKVASGILAPARIPIAVGLGVGHASGAVPDPGGVVIPPGFAPGPGGGPDPNAVQTSDYLARDMTYKPLPLIGPVYQPVCPGPTLIISNGPPYLVTVSSSLNGASLFYSVDDPYRGFTPIASGGQVSINSGQTLYAYTSKVGYTNSNIVSIPAPYAPPGEVVVTGDPLNPTEPVIGDDSANVTVGGPLGDSI